MTDKAAIRELREKVEAGIFPEPVVGVAGYGGEDTINGAPRKVWSLSRRAHNGSLDAALALHEAVLPGWGYCIDAENSDPSVCVYGPDLEQVGLGNSKSPARAWLVAVLKAMEAENA